ncbi:hypothetical protein EV363DRAFT_891106 [Boletus edulis]|nr:hypothetical protein EV363DRAFT_891106 [Boletus edulis]
MCVDWMVCLPAWIAILVSTTVLGEQGSDQKLVIYPKLPGRVTKVFVSSLPCLGLSESLVPSRPGPAVSAGCGRPRLSDINHQQTLVRSQGQSCAETQVESSVTCAIVVLVCMPDRNTFEDVRQGQSLAAPY